MKRDMKQNYYKTIKLIMSGLFSLEELNELKLLLHTFKSTKGFTMNSVTDNKQYKTLKYCPYCGEKLGDFQ